MVKKAWAALVTRASYLPGLLTLERTLRCVSEYPLIVLATDSLGTAHRELISRRGIEVVGIQHLAPAAGAHGGFDDKFARFHDTWTKLQVFGVPGYDRLVLIDADTIMLRGMDELFDLPLAEDEIAAAPACTCNPFKFAHYPPDWVPANCSLSRQPRPTTLDNVPQPTPDAPRTAHLLNSGVVVLRPSTGLMETLVTHLNTSPTLADVQFPDQDVLADVFRGKWRVLPWWANSLKTERAVHKNIWEDSEVRLLHYILDKPWDRRPATSTAAAVANAPTDQLPPALITAVRKASPQESMTDYDELHSWWWAVYDQLIAEIKADGSADWEEVDRFVAH